MTDKQIADFILYRAKKNGSPFGLHSPSLSVCRNGRKLILAVKYEDYNDPFLVRVARGGDRALFTILCLDAKAEAWKSDMMKQPTLTKYDVNALPSSVKKFVSDVVIKTLKTKNFGLDLFALSHGTDPELVSPNETYEEVAIEYDLMAFGMNEEAI